jgi:excisionase family DNA binding protein
LIQWRRKDYGGREMERLATNETVAAASTPVEPLLSVAEVAAILRTSRKTVYRRVARGELQGVRAGGTLRFERKAVADYIAANRTRESTCERVRPRTEAAPPLHREGGEPQP